VKFLYYIARLIAESKLQWIPLFRKKCYVISVFSIRPLAMQMTTTHKDPVTCCCYNSSFNHVVTSSESSVIKVWDIENGDQVFEYSNIHGKSAVTAMCFDSTERRYFYYCIPKPPGNSRILLKTFHASGGSNYYFKYRNILSMTC